MSSLHPLISVIAVVLLLLPAYAAAPAAASSGPTRTPIKHVVIITMENHSFDNIFGYYPEGGNPLYGNLTSEMSVPADLLSSNHSTGLTAVPSGTFATPDPVEGYTAYHLDWNGGKMNGFASNSGKQSMTYYTPSQLAIEWDIAEQYAIADMYFSSALTATMPNRLYEIAGFSPIMNDYGPPPYIPYSETIFSELDSYGVSWAYYVYSPSMGSIVLDYVSGIPSLQSHLRSWSTFSSEVRNGTLPAVSYLMPIGIGVSGFSQHPSDNMLAGELWLLFILHSIMNSPLWNSTAVFINYDEGGGFYDSIPPPRIEGEQLGFRVPLILVSPYAKEDYVSSTVMNHASLLAFIDYNWMMPPLNTFVALSDIPIDMFTFTSVPGIKPRPPLNLSFPGIQMPSSLHFSLRSLPTASLENDYPMVPQFPLESLPYAREGSSSLNLSQMHETPYVRTDRAYIPVYDSAGFLAFTTVTLSVAAVFLSRKRK
ncbi:MAG: alkaline phosphatase family protein [Thermoplasmata archaeon YP2-bin.285]|uniref:Alkaline phosphatase family protein n=3 Tax=Candidatus Sysuiplasma superficiale TaxID=2823368 RepID=A0A8J7YJQ4_9ARCH|nr:alkaline phosphatase family protein [Candidatus Sysuiplasma superficiale]